MVNEKVPEHTANDSDDMGPLRTRIVLPSEDIKAWRQQSARSLMRVMALLGLPAAIGVAYTDYTTGKAENIPIYFIIYGLFLFLSFWRKASYRLQIGVVIAAFLGLSIFGCFDAGLTGVVGVMLVSSAVLTLLFFSRWVGVLVIGFSALSLVMLGWLYSSGQLVIPNEVLIDTHLNMGSWVTTAAVLVLLVLPMLASQNYLFERFTRALVESRDLMRRLRRNRDELERRVEARTRDMARRTRYLEATATIAREASMVLDDPQQLLSRVVDLISEQFGFYHAGIFLLDLTETWAELQAASSEGGRRMLARHHRLRVGQEGTVGYVTSRGEPRIALDVGKDAVFFDNPDLPETRSAITLPLHARGKIIGALDVQSRQVKAFGDEDVEVLQVLADQVALAISNARLFQQAQEAVEAERRAYGELSREAWQQLLRTGTDLKFYSTSKETIAVEGVWRPEMRTALRTGQITPGADGMTLAIPVSVQGQVVGVIDGRKPEASGTWTRDEIDLLQALTDQMSAALEGARLYRETQRRAARERLVSEVTGRMRETLAVNTVLQTAVREIGEKLALSELVIRVGAPPGGQPDGNGGGN